MNQRRLVLTLNIGTAVIIGLLSLQLVRGWCGFRTESAREILSEKVLYERKDTERKPRSYYSIIEKKSLFGVARGSRPHRVERGATSSFRLKGTVILSSGRGYAILEDLATSAQRLYKLGDKVGNFRLVSIKWRKVVLRSSGGEKVLVMVSPQAPDIGSVQKEEKDKKVKQIAENKRIISRSFVQDAAANANEILTQLRIKPHFVNEISEGYWIGNIQPGSIVEEMGFRNGDIIKKINGEAVDSPEKILQVYQEIQKTGAVVVDVERDSRTETLTYEIRD